MVASIEYVLSVTDVIDMIPLKLKYVCFRYMWLIKPAHLTSGIDSMCSSYARLNHYNLDIAANIIIHFLIIRFYWLILLRNLL